ncbi:MAG: hypothetical protein HQ525_05865 [Anaerolineae bacterium]|nr:hypothetical protein [Anaerolineae bacterium]
MTNEERNNSQTTSFHQPEPSTPLVNRNNKTEDGVLRVMMLLISLISLGIAMISVAYVAVDILVMKDPHTRENIWSVVVAIGLAYSVGWWVALYGIRLYHNLVLPIFINIYTWVTLAGICALYIAILYRLYQQLYNTPSFAKYMILMGVTLIGFIGLHLLIENHSLKLYSVPLLLISLVHLYLIVYHYVFVSTVNYEYLIGDVIFFLSMATTSVLMLIHVGVLSGFRKTLDRLFEPDNSGNG